jgi:DDE superfamily endonuclease
MSRRKITRDDKNLPSDKEIARVLKIGQDLYIRNRHSPSSTWNYDETAFTWCLAPTHMWCPQNQQRATNIGISNSKMRITAVIAVNGEGCFAPLMLIVKHSASSEKRPDQTEMTVIRQMHKKEGFRISDGWSLEVWSRELTINNVTATHKVNYLIHGVTGHVITSQCKAWNDTVRVCLWFDIIIKPLLGERMLLWCDNCGSHKTTSVMEVIDEIGVDVAFLPKNMTGELQVLDLVVNGPLKAHVRTNRANVLYQSFQEYKVQVAADNVLPLAQRRNPEFSPPKPTMLGGIKDLILLFDGPFKETKFKDCINRTFIKTGTIPLLRESENIPHTFVVYKKEEQNGTMSIVPLGTMDIGEDDAEVIFPGTQNEENDVDALERIVLNYYAQNYDALQEDDDDDDDSTDDDTD